MKRFLSHNPSKIMLSMSAGILASIAVVWGYFASHTHTVSVQATENPLAWETDAWVLRLSHIRLPRGERWGTCFADEAEKYIEHTYSGATIRIIEKQEIEGEFEGIRIYKNTIIQSDLLSRGYAFVEIAVESEYRDVLFDAEKIAMREKQGIWSACPEYNERENEMENIENDTETTASPSNPPSQEDTQEVTEIGNNIEEVPSGTFSCDIPKKYCRDMRSWEEAQFYLHECGLTRIDGNDDGEACESLK